MVSFPIRGTLTLGTNNFIRRPVGLNAVRLSQKWVVFGPGCVIWLRNAVCCEIPLLPFHCVPCLCIALATKAVWIFCCVGIWGLWLHSIWPRRATRYVTRTSELTLNGVRAAWGGRCDAEQSPDSSRLSRCHGKFKFHL